MYQLNSNQIQQVSGSGTGDLIACGGGIVLTAFETITGNWWALPATILGTVGACVNAYEESNPKIPKVEPVYYPTSAPTDAGDWIDSLKLPDEPVEKSDEGSRTE